MKKTLLMMALSLGLFACGNDNANGGKQMGGKPNANVVEVLYFHGKQRCPTCRAIEKEAEDVVCTTFADEVRKGTLVFRSLDIDENEALADKYQVTWSSLVIVDYGEGKENAENMTKFAFSNARKSPSVFRSGLAGKIREMLN